MFGIYWLGKTLSHQNATSIKPTITIFEWFLSRFFYFRTWLCVQIEWTTIILRSRFLHMRHAFSTNASGSLWYVQSRIHYLHLEITLHVKLAVQKNGES